MKTKSFLLGAAALMLAASCSNDEVVNVAPQSGAIGFSSFVNNSTRAKDLTYADLEDLLVWGVTSRMDGQKYTVNPTELFNQRTVKKGDAVAGKDYWTYTDPVYWIPGNAFSFAAIAPASAVEQGVSVDQTALKDGDVWSTDWKEAGLTITFDNSLAKADLDLLYAMNDDVKNAVVGQEAVTLDFKHMLSRVKFQFENGLTNGETFVIKNLKIVNADSKATITKAQVTGLWTSLNDGTFEIEFKTETDNVSTENKYLIPLVGGSNYSITFTVERVKDGNVIGTYTHDGQNGNGIALGNVDFKNNCSYVFKTTIDNTNIDEQNDPNKIEFIVKEFAGFTPDTGFDGDYELPKDEKTDTPAVGE